jgi:hypothetical protein
MNGQAACACVHPSVTILQPVAGDGMMGVGQGGRPKRALMNVRSLTLKNLQLIGVHKGSTASAVVDSPTASVKL